MMADYVAVYGLRIRLTDILNRKANKCIMDPPTIPEYIANVRPFVAECQFKRGHALRSAITDSFADEFVTKLTPGVEAVIRERDLEGSPGKHQKTGGQQA